MRVRLALILLSSCFLGLRQAHADPVIYNFTDINVPGGSGVHANGINNKGQIVGYYNDDVASHGFLDTNGQVTSIDVPGATYTTINAINDLGQMVGSYLTPGFDSHVFLHTNGTITVMDIPGSSVQLNGINNAGQIVGSAQISITSGFYDAGFLYTNGAVTTIQVPGSTNTYALGINNVGQIVGNFFDATGAHGFLYTNGTFTTIDAPALVGGSTYPTGINDSGVIVGVTELLSSQTPTRSVENIFIDDGGVFTVVRSAYLHLVMASRS